MGRNLPLGVALGVALAATVVSLALPAAADSAYYRPGERPRPVHVLADVFEVKATQGSYCYFADGQGMCADYHYPLPVRGRLPLSPGERITILMHDRSIKRLELDLLRVDGDRPVDIQERGDLTHIRRSPHNRRAWWAKVPADASGANRISISAVYKRGRGDSNWWAGIVL